MPQVHKVYTNTYYRTFSRLYPVLQKIQPGDTVVTRCTDSGGQDEQGVHRSEPGNPLTGPFYIEGAEPGDGIAVRLVKVRCNRNWGYTSYRLGLYALTPDHVEKVYSSDYKMDLMRKGRSNMVPWDIDVQKAMVKLREPVSKVHKLEFPARPMLGCIGVAPAGDFAPTSGPSGAWGGNIDYNEIAEGATVHLPVYHHGALLYVGDGHALQGDGESLGTGIETSMDVEMVVTVRKKADYTGPRVENATHIISLGSQPEFASSLNRGLEMATSDMVAWLVKDFGMEEWAAHQLIGMIGRFDVATVAGSMALRIERKYLPQKSA